MSGLIARARHQVRIAARKGGFLALAALLGFVALLFVLGALVAALTLVVPVFAALLITAFLLFAVAASCALIANARQGKRRGLPDRPITSRQDMHEWRRDLQDHAVGLLSRTSPSQPRKFLLAGLAAGGAILALEALGRRMR